jgi:hypothetical protein
MKILSLIRTGRRTAEWTYTARGDIWRIETAPGGKLVGETRDQARKEASFFCLEEQTGLTRWEDRRLEEPWWAGIEAVQGDTLLLHQFAQPDMPEHRRIIALDIDTGTERWRNDELAYWFGIGNNVYAYEDTLEKRIGYALNLQTGVIERTFDENLDELRLLRSAPSQDPPREETRFPEVLDESVGDPSIVSLVERETKGKRLAGPIEHVKERGLLLFDYHELGRGSTPEKPLYDNRFAIVDLQRKKKVFSEIIARGLRTPVPDSFFLRGPFVFFIKNRNILTAVRL